MSMLSVEPLKDGITKVRLHSLSQLSQRWEYGCRRTAATAAYQNQFPCMAKTETGPKIIL